MFNELKGLSKHLYLKYQVDELIKLYRNVQIGLSIKLRDVNLTSFQQYRAEQILKQVNEIITVLDRKVYKWAEKNIPIAYTQGIDLAAERLRALKVTRFVAYDAQVHTSAINILINDVASEMLITNTGMRKNIQRYLLQTQQQVLQEKEISSMIAEGLIGGETRREVSGKLLDEFRKKMNDKQFIVINGRNYRPDSYATLIARTRTVEASSQAILNTSLRYGVDLVQWDSHSEVCEYCQQFSGRVFSISGTDKDFPKLKEKPPLHPNSYDKETQIYTSKGWQDIKDVNVGESCLSLNPNTFNLEWIKVKQIFKHKENKMVFFNSRNLDLLVTHNHNMFYITDWNYKHNKNKFNFIEAKNLIGKKSGAFYRGSEWQGKNQNIVQLGDKKISIKLYAEFMGWYLSEGCSLPQKGRRFIQISQSKKVNFDKYEIIKTLLNKIGFKYRAFNDGFIINSASLSLQMAIYSKCNEKYIPLIIKNAEPDIIRIFLNAFNLGDGSRKKGKFWKGGKFNDERTYFTTSKRMADDLGELLLKVGKRPSFYLQKNKGKGIQHKNGYYYSKYDLWIIRECNSKYSTLNNLLIKEVDYNDYSYCVELEKNHTLWIRRNGKTVWCGNCKCSITPITRTSLESRGYLNEVIKLSNAPSIKIDSFSRFEEVISQL